MKVMNLLSILTSPNGNLTGDEYYEIKTSQQLFTDVKQ